MYRGGGGPVGRRGGEGERGGGLEEDGHRVRELVGGEGRVQVTRKDKRKGGRRGDKIRAGREMERRRRVKEGRWWLEAWRRGEGAKQRRRR